MKTEDQNALGAEALPLASRETHRASLPEDHPIAVLMDEHQRLLKLLARMEELATGPRLEAPGFQDLARLAERLMAAEPHHMREEKVIFPALRERGIVAPTHVLQKEHEELRAGKQAIFRHAVRSLETGGEDPELRERTLLLVQALRNHIQKEDEVLYPMALSVIEPQAWAELKIRCDVVGYCCTRDGDSCGH